MKDIYLVADEFETDYIRGGQLNDAALLSYLNYNIKKIHSINLVDIDKNSFYIIGNFIGIQERIKNALAEKGNYVIYEKDHKYALITGYPRHPLVWPNGIVPKDKLKWEAFYNGAKAVICLTEWHEQQVKKNLPNANTVNIHGTLWTSKELDAIDYIREQVPHSRQAVIHNIAYKNPSQAIYHCNKNHYNYTLLPRINDKRRFLEGLCQHKILVFMPDIPETCSRMAVEAKMLGLKVETNQLVGATYEDWWKLQGKQLTDHFRNIIIPNAINLFKGYIDESN